MLWMVAQMTFARSERAHGKDALGCYDSSRKQRKFYRRVEWRVK